MGGGLDAYRGTSLIRKRTLLGPYSRPMPRVLGGFLGVGVFLWARYPFRELGAGRGWVREVVVPKGRLRQRPERVRLRVAN